MQPFRRALAVLAALIATAIAVDPARACDCMTPTPSAVDGRAKLATVVHGRVIAARVDAQTRDHQIDLLVLRAWKGATAGATITVLVDGSSCGYFLAPGDEAMIYAPARGPLQQCVGDDTARVTTGAGIAADAAALGPPTSAVAAPASTSGPTADVVAEGKVMMVRSGGRVGFQIRVTKAVLGVVRRQSLDVISSDGACAVAAPAVGSRVAVRAVTVRRQHVVSNCLADLGVRTLAPAPRRPRRP